jgi:hypothetical protein
MNTNANHGMTTVPLGMRIVALALRAALVGVLIVLVARVSSPLNETIWTAYETPGDLVRVVAGLVACLWMLHSVFTLPKDAEAYRTWIYIGLIVTPFALACVIALW